MRRARTLASGRRAASAAATAAASLFAAQTTTDGPEPESVTPGVPGTGSRAARRGAARPRRDRLVQEVVERGREEAASPEAIAAPRSAAWALAAAAASRARRTRADGERDPRVHPRVGTTTIGASGRSVATRRGAKARCRCARSGRRRRAPRRRDCRRAPRAAGRARAPRRRGVPARDGEPGDEAGGDGRRADEPSPRSSGMRLTKRNVWPVDGATSANARSARCSRRPRQLVGALALERHHGLAVARRRPRARSRGRAPRPRSRSPGRGWPSSPVRGRRARAHRPTSARIASRFGRRPVASASTSTAAVSLRPWPVRTQTTVLPGLELDARETREARGGRRLAEDALGLAISSQASVISASSTVTISTRPSR